MVYGRADDENVELLNLRDLPDRASWFPRGPFDVELSCLRPRIESELWTIFKPKT